MYDLFRYYLYKLHILDYVNHDKDKHIKSGKKFFFIDGFANYNDADLFFNDIKKSIPEYNFFGSAIIECPPIESCFSISCTMPNFLFFEIKMMNNEFSEIIGKKLELNVHGKLVEKNKESKELLFCFDAFSTFDVYKDELVKLFESLDLIIKKRSKIEVLVYSSLDLENLNLQIVNLIKKDDRPRYIIDIGKINNSVVTIPAIDELVNSINKKKYNMPMRFFNDNEQPITIRGFYDQEEALNAVSELSKLNINGLKVAEDANNSKNFSVIFKRIKHDN